MNTIVFLAVAAIGLIAALVAYELCRRFAGVAARDIPLGHQSSNIAKHKLSMYALRVADEVSNIVPLKTKAYSKLNKRLLHAGLGSLSPTTWRGIELISILIFSIAGLLLGLNTGNSLTIFLLVGLLLGVALPKIVLKSLTDKRQKSIEAEIANVLEELSIAVKSGYSIERGVKLIGTEMTGVLAEEFRRVDTDINSVGMDFTRAMKALAARCGCSSVNSFCAALIQARTQGTSISRVLESQAKLARQERTTQQMEEVNKLPGKLVAPIFGIMMLIIVLCLAPPIYNMIGVFGSAWDANGAGSIESLSDTVIS